MKIFESNLGVVDLIRWPRVWMRRERRHLNKKVTLLEMCVKATVSEKRR